MMVPTSTIAATATRYAGRTQQRDAHAAALAKGSPATADTPARVEKRMMRLAATAVAEGVASAPKGVVAPAVSVFERILGKSELMSVTFLERAVAASRTVARIRIRSGGRTIGYGTGSLVGPRVLLTNNHVLGSAQEAAESLAEFNYQDGVPAPAVFALDPDTLFVTDPVLDYTLVAVRDRSADDVDVASLGYNRLIEAEGKVLLGESLNIIQHPNGELKQVALRENMLADILPQFLHYKTDTAPGSSGSPVFNDQWELVALHHSGVPSTDAQGRYLTSDGTLWDASMGEHRIHWIANEGARVSRIAPHLQQQTLPPAAQALRASLFALEAAATMPGVPVPPRASAGTGQSAVVADGVATWTIPIQVSISVGDRLAAVPRTPAVSDAPVPIGPAVPQRPASATSTSLQDALAAVEAAKAKEYFNEAKDTAARTAYYAGFDAAVDADGRFDALSALLASTHGPKPAYKPSTHVYPFVDLHPDRKLRSIYSQRTFEPEELVREDFRIQEERDSRLQGLLRSEAALSAERIALEADRLEADLPFNCEHVVPQSWYDKDEPMRGDLHHLFACEPGCNSFRGNIPFFDFPDFEEVVRTDCGKREGERFEPGAAKGIVARATLYFLLRYPGKVNGLRATYDQARLATLLSWHASHPVSLYERHRNAAIFEKQGNRNPLIDHPEWAATLDFGQGL
ncbi:MAG: endonuclease [Vicinamibacteraceae bacterium]